LQEQEGTVAGETRGGGGAFGVNPRPQRAWVGWPNNSSFLGYFSNPKPAIFLSSIFSPDLIFAVLLAHFFIFVVFPPDFRYDSFPI
jgi:hypothetical protein